MRDIFDAIYAGDRVSFARFAKTQANKISSWNITPLHSVDFASWADVLLKNGAYVDARDHFDRTPLMNAVTLPFARILVKHGADVNAKDMKGRNVLFFDLSLELFKWFIEQGADVNARDNEGMTPLFTHIKKYWHLKALLEAGADATAVCAKCTALHVVVNVACAKLLVKHGCDWRCVDAKGRSVIHRSVSKRLMSYFIHLGVDVNARSHTGDTPLMLEDDVGVMDLLLDAGADINARNIHNGTALTYCDKKAEFFLIMNGIDASFHKKAKFLHFISLIL